MNKQLLRSVGDGESIARKEELQRKMIERLQEEVGYELQREYYEDEDE
jgi:hypothetical protein